MEHSSDKAFRVFRGEGGQGRMRGQGGMRHHWSSHHGHDRNYTSGNHSDADRIEWLNQTCTENGIVCSNVSADVLANCTNFTSYGHHGHDWDRDLHVAYKETGRYKDKDVEATKLRGNSEIYGNRDLNINHHGNHEQHHDHRGQDDSRWGNATDAELAMIRLNHLTCRCCENFSN
ncbi:hypothetical protein ACHAWX_005282 [Stephanocyclus meneghinianus]